jgi:hypothetical protein
MGRCLHGVAHELTIEAAIGRSWKPGDIEKVKRMIFV